MKSYKRLISKLIIVVMLFACALSNGRNYVANEQVPDIVSEALAAVPVNNDDWLFASGNKIVDKNGNEVWITGANWFGFNTGTNAFDGLWSCNLESALNAMADRGINLLRIPISVELVNQWAAGIYPRPNVNTHENPGLVGKTSLDIMDITVNHCKTIGMKIMFDIHSAKTDAMGHMHPLWYHDSITTEHFYQALEWLTNRYKNDDTVLAMDLKNEPHGKPYQDPANSAIWDNSTSINNWKHVAETAAKRILAINPNMLIVVEGIESYPKEGFTYASRNERDYYNNWWGGNLRGVKDHPINLGAYQNKLIYSPHDYGPSVWKQPWFYPGFNQQTLYNDCWKDNWAFIHDQNIAPLLIGEWGGFMDGGDNQKWMTHLRDYMIEKKISHTFWCFNANSGDTGGLVLHDFKTWDEQKYNFLKPALWQNASGKFVGLDHQVPLGRNGITISEYYGAPAQKAATPTFSVAGGTYTSAQTVAISSATAGAAIYYTTNGSTPTTSSTRYTGPITVSSTTTIRAIAVASGMSNSDVASATYTINIPVNKVATPTFSVPAGTYTSAQTVEISCATPGATIRYTTNGTNPTSSSPIYTAPITVSSTATIRAMAMVSGMTNSDIASVAYTITTGPVGNTPVAINGKLRVQGTQLVNQHGQPIQLKGMSSHGLQWYGQYMNYDSIKFMRDSWGANVVRAAMYTSSGGYISQPAAMKAKVREIVDASIDLGMYVIIDWHILSDGNPQTYQNEARAFFAEMSALYKDHPNVIYEIANEPNGNITWAGNCKPYAEFVIPAIRANAPDSIVIVGSPTWSQDIHHAADNPLSFNNIMYALHFYAGTHTQWLRDRIDYAMSKGAAIFVSEWGTSSASGDGGPYLEESKRWIDFMDSRKLSWCNWSLCDKAEVSAALRPGASTNGGWTDANLTASGLFVKNNMNTNSQPPVQKVATPTFSVPGGTYSSAQTVAISTATAGATIYYTTNGTTPTTSSTLYTGPITVGATTTLRAIAVASGMTNSDVASATYTINIPVNKVATPTFSVPGGTYTSAQNVAISTTTAGATIYYTTNGTTPTTSSTRYTGPITVSGTSTIRAIAVATGMTNSDVASATYTISTPVQTGIVVTYTVANDWGSGATVEVTIRNNGTTPINGWTLNWVFAGNQRITNLWNGTYTQSGGNISVRNMNYNGTIAANGGTQTFGFNISYSGTNARPTSFTLNGIACQVQ